MLRHRIAWQFGCTVEELDQRLTSSALTYWAAFVEYFADIDQDARFGRVAAAVWNAAGGKISGRAIRPEDVFPRLAPPRLDGAISAEEIAARMSMIPDFGPEVS